AENIVGDLLERCDLKLTPGCASVHAPGIQRCGKACDNLGRSVNPACCRLFCSSAPSNKAKKPTTSTTRKTQEKVKTGPNAWPGAVGLWLGGMGRILLKNSS